jgi:leucyl aminopeptidase
VSPELTRFTMKLIETYVKVPVREDVCGYACSDHASWTRAGYPAVFPFEAMFNNMNKSIHTANDTIEKLDMDFGLHFTKLATAFAVELSAGK